MAKKVDNNWYVTATDIFWGSSDAPSKMVMVCPDLATARKWFDKWDSRSDLRRVNIRSTKPYYGARVQCSFYDGANGGSLIESKNNERILSKIHKDFSRIR